MKKSNLRRLLAVLVAFAIMLTTCGLGTFVFAADPDLVVNDGSDTTKVNADASYTVTSEDNAVTNSKALNLTKNNTTRYFVSLTSVPSIERPLFLPQ